MCSLNQLWEEAHTLSLNFSETTTQTALFKNLLARFQVLEKSPDLKLQRIGRLARIFDGHWNQRQWLNLIVPLERYLDRRLTDIEIIGNQPDKTETPKSKLDLIVIADHWRSAFNVGSLFRMADGFGIKKIILTGYTPTPNHPAVEKTALGSLPFTDWEHIESTREVILRLREEGISTWALETTSSANVLGLTPLPSPLAILLGNERFGLDPSILNDCDGRIRIPLQGIKNSMNVATCLGIFAFEWRRQNGSQ